MGNDEQSRCAGTTADAKTATGTARGNPPRQRVRGFAGRLRPYRDVRAGFEPWRRVALLAWTLREETSTLH